MSQMVVLPDREFRRIVNKVGSSGIVVLMPKSLADKYGLEDEDDRLLDYDAGGEADLWVEVASNKDHYVFSWLKEKRLVEMSKDEN